MAARLDGASIAITNKAPITAATLERLPALRLVAVVNIRAYAVNTVPEHTFALILALRRNLVAYRARVLGPATVRVAVEAAVRFGWDRYLGERGGFIGMAGFGASGPAEALYEHFGIVPSAVVAEAKRLLQTRN